MTVSPDDLLRITAAIAQYNLSFEVNEAPRRTRTVWCKQTLIKPGITFENRSLNNVQRQCGTLRLDVKGVGNGFNVGVKERGKKGEKRKRRKRKRRKSALSLYSRGQEQSQSGEVALTSGEISLPAVDSKPLRGIKKHRDTAKERKISEVVEYLQRKGNRRNAKDSTNQGLSPAGSIMIGLIERSKIEQRKAQKELRGSFVQGKSALRENLKESIFVTLPPINSNASVPERHDKEEEDLEELEDLKENILEGIYKPIFEKPHRRRRGKESKQSRPTPRFE